MKKLKNNSDALFPKFGIWIIGILLSLSFFLQLPTMAQSDGVRCFENNSSIPISPSLELMVTEGGPAISYTLRLCTKPQKAVQVKLDLDDKAHEQLSIAPTENFQFTKDNWQTPQSVTIQAIDNDFVEAPTTLVTIGHRATSEDDDYNYPGITSPRIRVIIKNNQMGAYLPVVYLQPSPTPTYTPTPTATRTPRWELLAATPEAIAAVTISNNQIFAGDHSSGTQSGIYRAEKCEFPIEFTHIYSDLIVKDLVFYNQFGLAATFGRGTYYSNDGGITWQPAKSSTNPYHYAVLFINQELAYAGADDGIYSSNDQGENWNFVKPASGQAVAVINALSYNLETEQLWIATHRKGIWTLDPDTNQFEEHTNGLNVLNDEGRVRDILALSGPVIYLGTGNGVYKGNGQDVWQQVGLPGEEVLSLQVVDDQIYAGLKNHGVKSTNLKTPASWSSVAQAVPNTTVNDLFVDAATGLCAPKDTARSALLAGSENGLWIYR